MAEGCVPGSWFGRVGETYNMLWKMVIRPPRDVYSYEELGPAKFRLGKRVYERHDLQLASTRGILECSHFVPAKTPRVRRPCVVYLHGNCSSRLEAFDALPVLLPRDLTVFCLDLSGSGRSDGEYISLGYHEEQDLRTVLEFLRSQDHVSSIGLWGRSMGATTSILRASEDHALAACVLDSAFKDLQTVAEELVSRGRFPIPQFVVSWALDMVRSEVQSRAEFDPLELAPIKHAPRARCPALFGVASDDTFVLPHHTQELHNAWAGERSLRVFDGGHNGVRPTWFLEEAADFLLERLGGVHREALPGRVRASLPIREDAALLECTPRHDLKDEDDASDEEGRPTPRLVSPLTDRVQLEADSAAGPAPAVGGLAEEVLHHYEAARPSSHNVVGLHAAEPARPQPSQLPRKPSSSGGSPATPDASPLSAAAASAPPAPTRRVGPPGASLAQQLRFLGFGPGEVDAAAKRSLTIEAAMEYLASANVTVHL